MIETNAPRTVTEPLISPPVLNDGLAARTVKYSREFDAYYKTDTGEWLEEKCNDPFCEVCKTRPLTANEARL